MTIEEIQSTVKENNENLSDVFKRQLALLEYLRGDSIPDSKDNSQVKTSGILGEIESDLKSTDNLIFLLKTVAGEMEDTVYERGKVVDSINIRQ